MEKDLFSFDSNDFDFDYCSYFKCRMLRDFGPVKKNDEYDIIVINYVDSTIEFINISGDSEEGTVEEHTAYKLEFCLWYVKTL